MYYFDFFLHFLNDTYKWGVKNSAVLFFLFHVYFLILLLFLLSIAVCEMVEETAYNMVLSLGCLAYTLAQNEACKCVKLTDAETLPTFTPVI